MGNKANTLPQSVVLVRTLNGPRSLANTHAGYTLGVIVFRSRRTICGKRLHLIIGRFQGLSFTTHTGMTAVFYLSGTVLRLYACHSISNCWRPIDATRLQSRRRLHSGSVTVHVIAPSVGDSLRHE